MWANARFECIRASSSRAGVLLCFINFRSGRTAKWAFMAAQSKRRRRAYPPISSNFIIHPSFHYRVGKFTVKCFKSEDHIFKRFFCLLFHFLQLLFHVIIQSSVPLPSVLYHFYVSSHLCPPASLLFVTFRLLFSIYGSALFLSFSCLSFLGRVFFQLALFTLLSL